MSTVGRLHLLATYAFLSVGTTMLWAGEPEGTFPYPALVAGASLAAFLLTDLWQVFRLPHWLSNLLAFVIVGRTLGEFGGDSSSALPSLGHLLVYLQTAKSFREKSRGDIQLLYAVSLLQVAIGSVLSRGMAFGGMLAAYVFLGIACMTLDQLSQHAARAALSKAHFGPRLLPPNALTRGAVALGAGWLALFFLALPIGLALFLAIPRFDPPALLITRTEPNRTQLLTGYSESVRLDEIAAILRSTDVVFAAKAVDVEGRPARLPDHPFWRGMVFLSYQNREWFGPPRGVISPGRPVWADEPPPLAPGQVRLSVNLKQPIGNVLFAPKGVAWAGMTDPPWQVFHVEADDRLRFLARSFRSNQTSQNLYYDLIVDARGWEEDQAAAGPVSFRYLELARAVPQELTGLRNLSQRLVQGIPEHDVQRKIRRILDYIGDEREFRYTLAIQAVDPKRDPIEDFLFNRKAGHCEYFASAAALLLRCVGVPTRIVNGFKGAEFDETAQAYLVRQWMAHSWVEAWSPESGGWVTLDPTPGQGDPEDVNVLVAAGAGGGNGTRIWYDYIVDFNNSEQAYLYGRYLKEPAVGLFSSILGGLDRTGRAMGEWIGSGRWASGQGIVLLGLAIVAAIAIHGARRTLAHWASRIAWRRGHGSRARRLPPYDRFFSILRRLGKVRRPGQTPREFADELSAALAEREETRDHAALPMRLVDAYYDVRFGGAALDAREIRELSQAVRRFARLRRRTLLAVAAGANGNGRAQLFLPKESARAVSP